MESRRPRLAIVTGAGTGIGCATATLLLERGHRVIMLGRTEQRLLDAKGALSSEAAHRAVPAVVDVTDYDSLVNLFTKCSREWGLIDALINCAGLNIPSSTAAGKSTDWDQVIATNLTGTYNACKAFIPLAAECSAVVNVSSVQARQGGRSPQYAASKAGVEALTRVLARELAPTVRVNCVSPGPVETEMSSTWDDDLRRRLQDECLLKRIAQPAEIATAIAFLISSDASFMTGSTMHVNGGSLLN